MSKDEQYEELEKKAELMSTGYGGIDRQGNIVDRRKNKSAVAVKENSMMGIPKPKEVKTKFEKWVDKKINDCYYGRTRFNFIPFYFELLGYRLCIYAMNQDWESVRIKIEDVKDGYRISKVLKEGKY